jgi:hypothetical protein
MSFSETPRDYAPLLTQMLAEFKLESSAGAGSRTVFNVPFIAVVAASLARRCAQSSLFIEELRSSVETQIILTEAALRKRISMEKQIISTETSWRKHAKKHKDDGKILDLLMCIKKWATECRDAVSFGQIMSLLKVQYVRCMRLFIHDSSILQLFGYICERIRLNGESLPLTLEALLDDQRVSRFLFLDGRPKTLAECERGIERWSDPAGMLKNIQLTQDIFHSRSEPTLTQRILDEKGRVTHDMVRQLNGKPLEDYLSWEFAFPDPIRLEATVISAVSTVAGKIFTGSRSSEQAYLYLRNTVLYNRDLEEQLLSNFMKQYEVSVQDT